MHRWPFFALLLLIVVVGASGVPAPMAAATTSHATLPKIGQLAPGFTLRDQNGRRISLATASGAKVVLVFYRGYW
jgi:cytochrome oxidase Cu insertion factor (SCO1/SenC/PrrC family)